MFHLETTTSTKEWIVDGLVPETFDLGQCGTPWTSYLNPRKLMLRVKIVVNEQVHRTTGGKSPQLLPPRQRRPNAQTAVRVVVPELRFVSWGRKLPVERFSELTSKDPVCYKKATTWHRDNGKVIRICVRFEQCLELRAYMP